MCKYPVGGIELHTPVMNGAGTMGFGASYADYFDLNELGALVTRSVTLTPRQGNVAPRLYETPSGILNAVGFQNPGIDGFTASFYNGLEALRIPVILSLYGTPGELERMCIKVKPLEKISAVTVNTFIEPEAFYKMGERAYYAQVGEQVEACRVCGKPVWVKLMPLAGDIVRAACAAQQAGAKAAVCCNAFWAKSLNPSTGKSRLGTPSCFLSGPAVKPLSLFMAARVAKETKLDVVGCGGIMDENDAREYLAAGAKAVAVGTASFVEPQSAQRIAKALGGEGSAWK